jgi:hypothetical protein
VDPDAALAAEGPSARGEEAHRHRFAAAGETRALRLSLQASADISDPEAQPRVGVHEERVVLRLEADGGEPHLVRG